jgi:hypothetical protein
MAHTSAYQCWYRHYLAQEEQALAVDQACAEATGFSTYVGFPKVNAHIRACKKINSLATRTTQRTIFAKLAYLQASRGV